MSFNTTTITSSITTPRFTFQPSADNTTTFTTAAAAITEIVSEQGVKDLPLGASLLFINFCIIVFNVLTIAVIVRFRTKNAIDIFVLALATTDLIKGLIPVPMSVYIYLTDWHLEEGTIACNFFGWIAFATNSGSMLVLTLMSIERFFAIAHPFAYKAWVRPNKIVGIILVAEIFTAIHSTLPLVGIGRVLPYNDGAYSHFDYSRHSNGTIGYSIFIICYGFSMILVVMIAYSFVFHKIRDLIYRHRRMTNSQSDSGPRRDKSTRQLNLKTETMFSYLTVALMVLFWFSWLPFLMVVVASQIDAETPHEKLDLFAIRIAVVNSMLNPIACAALCKPYRRGIMYYFRMFLSWFGFKKPDNNVWDPWKKHKYKRRHNNTRRHKPSVVDFNDYDMTTRSDVFSNSYDDSGFGTGEFYDRARIPSVLDSFESYRARLLDNDSHDSVTTQPSNQNLSKQHQQQPLSSKHAYGRSHAPSNIDEDESVTSSSSASDNDDREGEMRKKSGTSSRKSSNKSTRNHHQKKEEESADAKNGGKNAGTPTPSQRRKIVFYEKVQKYINQKRQRKHSLDLLDDGPHTRRSISAGDLLDPDYIEMQAQNPGKRKTKSFKITSSSSSSKNISNNNGKNKNEEIQDSEEDTNERDILLMLHGRRDRACTLGDMDELPMKVSSKHPSWLELNQNNATGQQQPYSSEDTHYSHIPLSGDRHSNQPRLDSPLANGSAYTIIEGPPDTPGSHGDERRCISEAFPDEVTIPMDTIGDNKSNNNGRAGGLSSVINVNNSRTSHHSLKMIDHITKELVQFSQTSLNVDSLASRNQQIT